jgi:hypothetical protein
MPAKAEEPRSQLLRLNPANLAVHANPAVFSAGIARKVRYMDMLLGLKPDASAALLAHKFSRSKGEMHEELFSSQK